MRQVKYIFALLIMTAASTSAVGQTMQTTFSGWWAETHWQFDFNKDGTYKRSSVGHYGSTLVKGKYEMKSDTIHLLTGFQNTSGTVNEFYLLDKQGYLIDLRLLYDYRLQSGKDVFYNSRKRLEYQKSGNSTN